MSGSRSQTAPGILPLLSPTRKQKQTSAEIKTVFFRVCLYNLSRKLTSRCLGLQIMQGPQLVYTDVEDPPQGWRLSRLSDQLSSLKVRARKSHVPVCFKSGRMIKAKTACCSGKKSLHRTLSVPQHPCWDVLSDWARTSKELEHKTISGPRNWESVKSSLWTLCRNGHLEAEHLNLQQSLCP